MPATARKEMSKIRFADTALDQKIHGFQRIVLMSGSDEGLTEEAPDAYKDIDDVIEVANGRTSVVAKLTPIGVVKG